MKPRLLLTCAALAILNFAALAHAADRATAPFDAGWRFLKSDAPGAEQPDFADAAWRTLDLPHDWSIEGPIAQNNPADKAGGFFPTGIGWYRKTFTVPADFAGRRVSIEFDGAMANSSVWLNGQLLGQRPFGYVPFSYDLTSALKTGPGASNVLAVRLDNSAQPAVRWYPGNGIYRHVRLVATDAVHIVHNSTFITTPQVSDAEATVHVRTTVVNESAKPQVVSLQVMLINGNVASSTPQSVSAAPQTIAPGKSADFEQDIVVHNPTLWSIASPALWSADFRVLDGDTRLDTESVTFGIRSIKFDAVSGFLLNGVPTKLDGVCLHIEAGAFGTAVPLAVWEQRLATLRLAGVNAIRTAHNAPDPGFLALCDRMGFAVMLETFDTWRAKKVAAGYQNFFAKWWQTDVAATVLEGRNHPCVVLYSIGNEIHDNLNGAGRNDLIAQRDLVHQTDPTRPVTMALFRPQETGHIPGVTDLLDVVGINYRPAQNATIVNSGRPTVDTEEIHTVERTAPIMADPRISGLFLWTGIDYLGESLGWPAIGQNYGLLDRTGEFKPAGLQRQSWWSAKPVVSIMRRTGAGGIMALDPGYENAAQTAQLQKGQAQVLFADWTPANSGPHNETVEVYSNCEDVELLLNGRSLGSKPLSSYNPRTWTVPFEPGVLSAVGKTKGQVAATSEIRTAGKQTKLELTASREKLGHTWDDAVQVRATVLDANGVRIYPANDLVTFEVSGPGVVVAVDNGDLNSHESFQATERHAFQGSCVAYIKATANTGTITVTARANGLAAGTTTLTITP